MRIKKDRVKIGSRNGKFGNAMVERLKCYCRLDRTVLFDPIRYDLGDEYVFSLWSLLVVVQERGVFCEIMRLVWVQQDEHGMRWLYAMRTDGQEMRPI